MIVAKGHGCSLLMLELCLVSVILFLSAKRVDQILQCCQGKFWRENPYALLILRARAVQLLSLVSKRIVVHLLCHVRHSLDVILLIKLYKNTVNCAGDLSPLHHVIATRNVRFDRRCIFAPHRRCIWHIYDHRRL